MLAIIGASGKIGGATLDALLSYDLAAPESLVCLTSAHEGDAKRQILQSKGVAVRHATFDDPQTIETALHGCEKFFLVSSPRIEMDFGDATFGAGREKDHFAAIEAARRAGVKHIYYTSLAFANPSRSRVMEAHTRTEAYLREKWPGEWTIIREGLYNESWPLYLGHYDLGSDTREELVIAGDGPISWTSISDLGLGSALILSESSQSWAGRTVYLSNTRDPQTLEDVAKILSNILGKEIRVRVVTRAEHEKYYIDERGMQEGMIKWWAKTYDALGLQECHIHEKTLEELLQSKRRTPKPLKDTMREMLSAS